MGAGFHSWFGDIRYGMFIHWGAYSVAARGEWALNRERIARGDYFRLYAEKFFAENYDPAAWAALAKDAGMGYAVLTARHHDGFALWPTETDDFHAGRIGPKRDLVGPYIEAMRAAGLKVGIYYSPASWYHPDYPGPYCRDWPAGADWPSETARERFFAFYRAQLLELFSRYGGIDYLWYDWCFPSNLQSREVNEELLRLQPLLLINERNGPPFQVKSSKQAIVPPKEDVPWEACMTLNENWGWHAGDSHWKNAQEVVRMLLETSANAGNLLLNVGPRPDGTIPEESARILREAGCWLRKNGEAIRGCGRSPFTRNNWGRVTVKNLPSPPARPDRVHDRAGGRGKARTDHPPDILLDPRPGGMRPPVKPPLGNHRASRFQGSALINRLKFVPAQGPRRPCVARASVCTSHGGWSKLSPPRHKTGGVASILRRLLIKPNTPCTSHSSTT